MNASELEAAGLYDPRSPKAAERLELLEWLASRGVTIEQMVYALREASLLGLAGDLALRPMPTLTLGQLAASIGVPVEQVRDIVVASGLRSGAPDEPAFTEADADIVRTFLAGAALLGMETALHFARRAGTAFAQLAEAAVALYLVSTEGPLVASQARELAIAQGNLRGIQMLDDVQVVLHALFRAHMAAAIRRQRQARRDVDTLRLTVGFVDLVGFTTLSRRMTNRQLAEIIGRFEESAHDVVAARDGRLVKLIGDEVMFVSVDAAAACDIALTILERFDHDDAVTPRGALATGDLLFRGGDYYGPIVNLAARLADLAVPRELLVTPEVAAQVGGGGLRFEAAGKRMLKGFDDPVSVLTVART